MPSDVVNDEAGSRFVLEQDGSTARLDYHRHGDRLVLIHTEVPDEMAGGGVGGALVQAALDDAAAKGLTVVPRCQFARDWIERHPDEAAKVAIAAPD
jgi:predicted GNAT family acetyltransferase